MALSICLFLLLSACTSGKETPDAPPSDSKTPNAPSSGSDALTWTRWNGFDNFLELASRTYPEIKWEYTAYAGANRTGYSWVQMRDGRAFPQTNVGWENILADVGKAFGSAVGADAVLIAINGDNTMPELRAGLTGKLYKGPINAEVATAITFGSTREYADMTMTGAQVKELAKTGFDAAGDGNAYPYVLVTHGDMELEDGETYRVAFTANNHTEEVGQACNVQVEDGTLSTFVRTWLEEQGTVSPDGNPWEERMGRVD